MCPSAPRVCSEPGGQKPVLSLSLDLIRTVGTHFREIWIKIQSISLKKLHSKMLSAKWQPFCSGPNMLKWCINSLWLGDTIWQYRWGLMIDQVMPGGTKPLPGPMLTYQPSTTKIILKITDMKFHSYPPGANKLTDHFLYQAGGELRPLTSKPFSWMHIS